MRCYWALAAVPRMPTFLPECYETVPIGQRPLTMDYLPVTFIYGLKLVGSWHWKLCVTSNDLCLYVWQYCEHFVSSTVHGREKASHTYCKLWQLCCSRENLPMWQWRTYVAGKCGT